jgi:uncharacterized protein YuzE
MMRLEHDPDADAIYIHLHDLPYAFGEDLDRERRIDYAADGQPIGMELLCVSHGVNVDDLPEKEAITRLLEERNIKVFA